MTFRVFAFVRLDGGGVARHKLGSYATADEAEQRAKDAVAAFAHYARVDGDDGTSSLTIARDYDERPTPPGMIHRVGMFRDDAANDESQTARP